jgi:hypothetical protein
METIKKIYNTKQENSFNKLLEPHSELKNELTTKNLCKLIE